ncbi:MAG: phosphonate ABC transporter, permease protein PhnE [Bdellovibrionales bacterium]|nr:phosphonate ABC transporter, permease protein PhnE [Bdellovibrionales bacterium]
MQSLGSIAIDEQRQSPVAAQPYVVEVQNIDFCYRNGCNALRDVSLAFHAGKHYAIMGPSGCGKTTLLGCISGRLSPQQGAIVRHGRVATIHQDLRLVANRTASENVLHGAMGRLSLLRTALRFPKVERARAERLIARVGLAAKSNTLVKHLSGGERQRVAIARALMQDPAILLADEPVAALDRETAHDVMQLISELAREQQLAVISVLHDDRIAESYADQIFHVSNGRLVAGREDLRRKFDYPLEPVGRSALPIVSASETVEERDTEPGRKVQPFNRRQSFLLVCLACSVYIWSIAELDIRARDLQGAVWGVGAFLKELVPYSWQQITAIPWTTLGAALVETIQMALLGTTAGVVVSWPLAALAAKNVGPRWLRRPIRFLLNVIRTVPSLIWALLFVAAVGLGSFAGVLALAAYSVGYLSKFFYEAYEGVDPGPTEALREIGASGLQRFLHAVAPASGPAVLSSCIFMLEYNVRAASVLGIVDAGGIGFYMKQYADYRAFPALLACLLLLLLVVVVFDAVSCRIRERLVQAE